METYTVLVSATVLMKVEVTANSHEEATSKTNKGEYKVDKILDTHSLEIQEIREQ